MAAARRNVFVEKVLKRLFPHNPHGQEKRAPLPAASETPPKMLVPDKGGCRHVFPSAGGGTATPASRRLYTAALPPEDYVPTLVPALEPLSPLDSEGAPSSDDAGGSNGLDQDPHDQPKRRIRKHKSKKKYKNLSSVHEEQAELEKQQSLLQEELQPRHTDGSTISKNKKRKLKKRRQTQRKRAAGLLKATGISFLYEPVEEPADEQGDAREGDAAHAEQDSDNSTNEKADEILDFLKSTQEMYFYDGVSKDSDPAFLKATEELLKGLEARSVPLADLLVLDHMKMLLHLQAPERLQRALQVFVDHCTMPPEHAEVISAFFNYWLTHVLPEKQ